MPIETDVQLDDRQRRQLQRLVGHIRGGVPKVIHHATRRTVTAVRVQIVNNVHQNLNVKKTDLFKRGNRRRPIQERLIWEGSRVVTGMVKVRGNQAGDDIESKAGGGIRAKQKLRVGRIPLGKFGPTQIRKGVSYRITRGGGRERVAGAFVATMRTGYRGVFIRPRTDSKMGELFGPSIPHVAERRPAIRMMLSTDKIDRIYEHNLASRVDFLLQRRAVND